MAIFGTFASHASADRASRINLRHPRPIIGASHEVIKGHTKIIGKSPKGAKRWYADFCLPVAHRLPTSHANSGSQLLLTQIHLFPQLSNPVGKKFRVIGKNILYPL
jgi:hypothetical protein